MTDKDKTAEAKNWRTKLFSYVYQEHGISLLETELEQIQHICFPPDYPYNPNDYPAPSSELPDDEAIKTQFPYNEYNLYDNYACYRHGAIWLRSLASPIIQQLKEESKKKDEEIERLKTLLNK